MAVHLAMGSSMFDTTGAQRDAWRRAANARGFAPSFLNYRWRDAAPRGNGRHAADEVPSCWAAMKRCLLVASFSWGNARTPARADYPLSTVPARQDSSCNWHAHGCPAWPRRIALSLPDAAQVTHPRGHPHHWESLYGDLDWVDASLSGYLSLAEGSGLHRLTS